MRDTPYNVLFVCTGNSVRSIMAESLMNHLGSGRYRAFSAGSHPTGAVNPFALQALDQLHLPAHDFRSKSWNEFAAPGSPQLDFVVTLCDAVAEEVCPIWPGQPMTAHWGMFDPAAVQGGDLQKSRAFHDTALMLKRRIELMLALPVLALDQISLKRAVRDIGEQ